MSQIRDRIAGWVNDSAKADPLEAARHFSFIVVRLALAAMAIVFIPPFMFFRGSLAPWETVIVVCAMTPMASIAILSRTGNFNLAFAVSAAGHVLGCLACASGAGALSGPTLVWLALAPMEALVSFSLPVFAITAAAMFATVALIAGGLFLGVVATHSGLSPAARLLMVVPAFAYAGFQTCAAVSVSALRSRVERLGAARHHSLSNVMGDLIMRGDRGGAVLEAGVESRRVLNLQGRDLTGRGFFERLLVQDRPLYLKTVADACRGDATATCVLRLRTGSTPSHQGDFREPVFTWIELRARRIALDDDALGRESAAEAAACVTMVVRDISHDKRREQEIEAARAEAERANAWKDRFLANMSHELRTPLNAIIGFSEILGNPELMPAEADKRLEYAGIIHGSGKHLLDVVNSVLDISKMEAGRFSISPEPFEIGPLVDSCSDIMSLKAEQNGVQLKREFAEGLPELVADKRACRQVLINLLGNALKFTPAGGVVTIGALRDGDQIAFYVSDTGRGMSAYDLPMLGGAFFQAGVPGDRTYEGTGLGLSVVRGLVGLHGGEISVESGLGLGTCVTVRLPIDCGEPVDGRASARIIVIPRGPAQPASANSNSGSWEIGRQSA